jgi:hypothetical protein
MSDIYRQQSKEYYSKLAVLIGKDPPGRSEPVKHRHHEPHSTYQGRGGQSHYGSGGGTRTGPVSFTPHKGKSLTEMLWGEVKFVWDKIW